MERSFKWETFSEIKSELHFNRYKKFILSRPERQRSDDLYTENHHAIPKSLGGINNDSNLILLTAREHFIAHMMLWKAIGGSMTFAFHLMSTNKRKHTFRLTAKQYQRLREDYCERMSIINKDLRWISKDAKTKMVNRDKVNDYLTIGWIRGRYITPEARYNISNARDTSGGKNGMWGRTHTKEVKEKLGRLLKERSSNSMWIHKEHVEKFILKNELQDFLTQNWVVGRDTNGIMNFATTLGKKLINNGEISKFVSEEEVIPYENKGWGEGCAKEYNSLPLF